jgi:hypothetical protein
VSEPSALDKAQELLAQEPLPPDVEKRLDALYEQATDDEKLFFADLYETLVVLDDGPVTAT